MSITEMAKTSVLANGYPQAMVRLLIIADGRHCSMGINSHIRNGAVVTNCDVSLGSGETFFGDTWEEAIGDLCESLESENGG